jgi:hypothetical protein
MRLAPHSSGSPEVDGMPVQIKPHGIVRLLTLGPSLFVSAVWCLFLAPAVIDFRTSGLPDFRTA